MKRVYIIIAAMMMVVSSCGTYTLKQSEVLNDANMASYKTFMIEPADGSTIPSYLSMNDVNNIYRSISKQLYDRGYSSVETNPDMIVYVAMSVQQVIQTKDFIPPGSDFGYRYFSPRGAYLSNYYDDAQVITGISKEGVLMVDILDARRGVHVFCSEVSSSAQDDVVNIKDLSKLDEAATVLFSKFPVPSKTK